MANCINLNSALSVILITAEKDRHAWTGEHGRFQ
jgi:hypothetical protein